MNRWIASLGSLVAVAGLAALALFLAGVFDGNDASGSGGSGEETAGVCVEGNPDCGDTGFVTDDDGRDTVAPGCEVGHVGVCDDTPSPDGEDGELIEGDGPLIQPVCAPGFPDCTDTIVVPADGEEVDGREVPIGTFDGGHQPGSQGSDDDIADGVAADPGAFATTGQATLPSE